MNDSSMVIVYDWWEMHWRCDPWEGRSSYARLVPYDSSGCFSGRLGAMTTYRGFSRS